MNPTKKLLNELDQYLESIPDRFIELEIEPNFQEATIRIADPENSKGQYIFEAKNGAIKLTYQEFSKTYYCNLLNYRKQIRKICDEFFEIVNKRKKEHSKPVLKPGQFAILYFESSTGIVLEVETLKKRIGWGNCYKVFQSEPEAFENAEFATNGESIECTILDHNYDVVKVIGR